MRDSEQFNPQGVLRVNLAHLNGRVELSLAGELDLAAVETLLEHVRALTSQSTGDVVLDLADLYFIDSSGLRALIDIKQSLSPAHRLVLRNAQAPVTRLFRLTGLAEHFAVE